MNQNRRHHNQEPKVIALAAAQESQNTQNVALYFVATVLLILSLIQTL